ncbi:MAG TPA: putative metalloprotease CJM1_0395 family protein [Rhodocyclaceae bacterium]|nr:putative metalloprotease CJM1_0395 family protein [Rhodocyclaceae bacterium]
MSSLTLNSTLSSIGISQATGVGIPLLRDQITGTVQGATKPPAEKKPAAGQLSPQQQQQVDQLQATDRKVRAHEQAHIAAGRELITSGPQYSYTYGPDGKQYAVGGEVGIDTSPEKKPDANIRKGERIQTAALAPAEPSQQDYSVAAAGSRLEEQGRADKLREEAQAMAQKAAEAEKQQEQQNQTVASDTNGDTSSTQSANATSRDLSRVYGISGSANVASQAAVSVFA